MEHSIFEQFAGADLDRLAECIRAIRKAGLSTGKHTQAGVNQGSGNVWVWDEDWAGCVACSIGFDVFWNYSCPECGDEHDFATYAELDGYQDAYENRCKTCTDDKPFHVVGIDENDGSATILEEFDNSGEARAWMQRYVAREDAGGWKHVEVLDTRDECAETLWRWEAMP